MGSGKKAAVGNSNRLDTSARSNGRIYYASRDDKSAYSVHFAGEQRTGGSTQGLGYLTYTGAGKLFLHNIIFSTEEPGTGLTKFSIWAKTTVSGGTSKTPININQTSSLTANADCYHDYDGAGTAVSITGGSSIYTIRLGGITTYPIFFDDAIILGINNTISFKSNAATAGTKVRATLSFFELA